jgi:hypothetical protein
MRSPTRNSLQESGRENVRIEMKKRKTKSDQMRELNEVSRHETLRIETQNGI